MTVSDRGDAVEMVVTGPWSPEAAAAAATGEVDRLVLNTALGFDESSLDFLRGQPIRQLVVLDRRLTSLEPIYSLAATLRSLSVTTDPSLTVDLERLSGLQDLSAAWSQVSRTIGTAVGLRLVHLNGYGAADLEPLESLHHLTELTLKDRPRLRSLKGVSDHPALRSVGIYLASNLEDIEDIAACNDLDLLALEACRKLVQIDPISRLTKLRLLYLSDCGDLESLAPLSTLTRLEELWIYGSTKILDGDLSPIAELPTLKRLRMQSRRTYHPSTGEIQSTLHCD